MLYSIYLFVIKSPTMDWTCIFLTGTAVDVLVMQETRVTSVPSVKSVSSDLKVLLGSLDALDRQGHLETLDSLDQPVSKVTVVPRDLMVSLEYKERSVLPVTLVFPVSLAVLVSQDK